MENKGFFLVCPTCRERVVPIDDAHICSNCEKTYPIKDNIVCFLGENDQFYEGAYTGTINFTCKNESSLKSLFYLYVIHFHYLWYIKKYIQTPVNILDVACGGGTRYLAQKGNVTGIDLSLSSLRKTTQFYQNNIQANILEMPFLDNSYDVITSSFCFEHLTLHEKRLLLSHFQRVLTPGGKIILLFDCDNSNPFFKWLKKYPDLYKQCFIEIDHHYGLQFASVNLSLFKEAGFKILNYRVFNKTPIQHLPVYTWVGPYSKVTKCATLISKTALYMGKFKYLNLGYQILVTLFDDVVEKFLPLNWGRLLLVILEK